MTVEEQPVNEYPVIENPDGQDIVPITEEGIDIIGEPNDELYTSNEAEVDRSGLARTLENDSNNIMLWGLVGVAVLVIIAAAFYQMKKKA